MSNLYIYKYLIILRNNLKLISLKDTSSYGSILTWWTLSMEKFPEYLRQDHVALMYSSTNLKKLTKLGILYDIYNAKMD